MTESKPRHAKIGSFVVLGFAWLTPGCRPGLPPVPPHADPANPDAPSVEWKLPTTTLDVSAFEGQSLDAGGHGHGGHMNMDEQPEGRQDEPAGNEHSSGGAGEQGHEEHAR